MNKVTFRPHRGTLQESIDASFEVSTLNDILNKENETALFPHELKDVKVRYYGFDERIKQHCYIVSIPDYGVLGFINDTIPRK